LHHANILNKGCATGSPGAEVLQPAIRSRFLSKHYGFQRILQIFRGWPASFSPTELYKCSYDPWTNLSMCISTAVLCYMNTEFIWRPSSSYIIYSSSRRYSIRINQKAGIVLKSLLQNPYCNLVL